MPKYVIFTPTWGKTVGGTAKVARGLLYAIKELSPESEFFVFSSDISGEPDSDVACVDGKLLGSRGLFYLSALRRIHPDLIHCQGRIHQLLIGYIYKRMFNPSVRLICSFYTQPTFKSYLPGDNISSVPETTFFSAVKNSLSVFLLNRADFVVCNSASLAENMSVYLGPRFNRSFAVIPSGVEIPQVKAENVDAFINQHGLKGVYPVFLTVGVFTWDWKVAGLLLLLDSFREVVAQCPSARLVIVGDGRYKPLVLSKIAALSLQGHVILTGNLQNTFVPISASHIYCHLALNESSSVSIIEAMVSGKPVIASRAGGNGELIKDEETGLLVEPRVLDVKVAMLRLINDKTLSAKLGSASGAIAAAQYNWRAIAEQYSCLYRGGPSPSGIEFVEPRSA